MGDLMPWWLWLLTGIISGSFAMYGPAYRKGQIDGLSLRKDEP